MAKHPLQSQDGNAADSAACGCPDEVGASGLAEQTQPPDLPGALCHQQPGLRL